MILEWHEGKSVVYVDLDPPCPENTRIPVRLSPSEVTVFKRIAEEARHD